MFKNASHTLSFIVVVSCYNSSGSTLNFFELIFRAYARGVPNRTAIFQDWAHQSCGQEYSFRLRKPSVRLASVIFADMCIPSQIIGDSDPRYLIISRFSRTIPSVVYEAWIFLIRFLVICIILHFLAQRPN